MNYREAFTVFLPYSISYISHIYIVTPIKSNFLQISGCDICLSLRYFRKFFPIIFKFPFNVLTFIQILFLLTNIIINLVLGENGVIAKAKWAAYVTEYETVKERQELYTADYVVKTWGKNNRIASINDVLISTQQQRIVMYPLSDKINIDDVSASLKETIKRIEGLTDNDITNETLVNLYKVDLTKINVGTKKSYAINIVSGMLYSIEYEKYNGMLWHTPRLGIEKDFNKIEVKVNKPGTYEIVVDAGQTVSWDSIRIFYSKYVENSLKMKVYTSDDEIAWKEGTIDGPNLNEKEETYNLSTLERTQYLKIEMEVKEVNGKNAEVDYILVNFYKYKELEVVPETEATGVEKLETIYTVPTSANGATQAQGTGTVVQKYTVPLDDGEYMLDLGEGYGTPTTNVTVTNPDGTEEHYTVTNNQELKKIQVKPGASVEFTTTLQEGEGIGEAKLLKKEDTLTTQKVEEMIPTSSNNTSDTGGNTGSTGSTGGTGEGTGGTGEDEEQSQNWITVEKQKYIYNNGGAGYWEKCFINETEVNETGIITKENETDKRIRITYQMSTDGTTWSKVFTNIQDAENTRYLRVIVEYQTINGIEYGDTSNNKIKIMLNDGSWKVSFVDEAGTELLIKRVYFENSNRQGTLTMPNLVNIENKYTLCKTDTEAYLQGSSYTVTNNMTFTVYTVEKPEISIKDITSESFTIVVNTNYGEVLLTEYKYYIGGTLKSPSNTTSNEFVVTGLASGTKYDNIYVEASFSGAILASDIKDATTVKIFITSLTLDKNEITLEKGNKETLTLNIEPSNATDKTFTVGGYDSKVATVATSGNTLTITGVEKGSTQITVTANDGSGKSTVCSVTVRIPGEIPYSWEELGEIAKVISNTSTITNDTNEVNITCNDKEYTLTVGDFTYVNGKKVRILGFNHDLLADPAAYGGANTYAGISFEYVDCLTTARMKATDTNTNGWAETELRETLNNTTINSLENKDQIKQVQKQYTKNMLGSVTVCSDKLWLLSCSEIWNNGFNYQAGYYGYANAKEGEQYKYHKNLNASCNKLNSELIKNNKTWWWLRSICCDRYHYGDGFCAVNYAGQATGGGANREFGVAPGFAI